VNFALVVTRIAVHRRAERAKRDWQPAKGFSGISRGRAGRALGWFRRRGEASERQWWDIVGVLKVTVGADRTYLRRWARRLGVTHLLERALTDADR